MAEDVVAGLEKMKLTVEEAETIQIADEGRREEIESCSLSLIGKFLTCKNFNKRAAKTTLKKAWGLENEVKIVEVGSNLFQFKFNTEFDLERVFKGGPWTFDNQMLLLTKWKKGMKADNVELNHASLWVQIWGAPFDMISARVATEIGSRLGDVVEVERRRPKQDEANYFMRVKVALQLSKPLRRGGFIAGSDGERSWITYKYERLPILCHFCGLLGHDLHHCARHFSATRNGDEVELQYGDWLKATGGRYRSPPKRKPEGSSEPNSGEENRGVDGEGQTPLVQTGIAAVTGSKGRNPTAKEGVDNGNSENRGDDALQNPIITAGDKLDKESGEENGIDEDHANVIANLNAMLEAQQQDQINVAMQTGPLNQKAKPTWVRLRRMECGPKETEGSEQMQSLGKRMATQWDEGSNRDHEARPGKKGKTEAQDGNSTEISARVVGRPCREQ